MLELKRTEYKINIYGNEVRLTPPTYKELKAFDKAVRENQEDETIVFDFLEARGLSKVISESMEVEHLFKVVEVFKQKKS